MAVELWLLAAGVAVIAYAASGWVSRHAARLGLVQVPNHRSSHAAPTPRGGGAGIVLGGVVAALWLGYAEAGPADALWRVLGLSVLVAGVGLWDDLRPLPVWPRLLTHALACLGAVWALGWGGAAWWPAGLVLSLAGVWWLNLFNFMDGIDGLAGGQAIYMLLAASGLAALFAPAATGQAGWWWMPLLAAATGGFLVRNWPPATLFMGDVGSTYLGFMLFAFCLASVGQGWLSLPAWLILGAVFVTDATATMLRRMLRGERWLEAHRDHAYQRLARRWGGHRPVTVAILAVDLGYLAPLAFATMRWPEWAWVAVAAAYVPLAVLVYRIARWSEAMADMGRMARTK